MSNRIAVVFLHRMAAWNHRYHVHTWIVEVNNLQAMYTEEPRVRKYAMDNGILIKPHQTHWNKHDSAHGVISLAKLFYEQRIDLPYASGEARAKMKVLARQLLSYDPGTEGPHTWQCENGCVDGVLVRVARSRRDTETGKDIRCAACVVVRCVVSRYHQLQWRGLRAMVNGVSGCVVGEVHLCADMSACLWRAQRLPLCVRQS